VLSKLILGTAQFGMQYGISNSNGKIKKNHTKLIVDEAFENSIRFIDTAPVYGDSEGIIGNLANSSEWNIITKIPKIQSNVIKNENIFEVSSVFESSLVNLCRTSVYGLVVHSCHDLLKDGGNNLFRFLCDLKEQKKIEKIGVSVYNSSEIEMILDNFEVDLIQVPINIFDQRLIKNGLLEKIKQKGIEIHARSIFLQGVILTDVNKLPQYFLPYIDVINKLENKAKSLSMTKLGLSLSFVNSIPQIDKIIFGVDSLDHLQKIINEVTHRIDFSFFDDLAVNDERLLNPGLWTY